MTTGSPPPEAVDSLDLVLFEHFSEKVGLAKQAGISSFLVDCEKSGKKARQSGFDTEINTDTPADLTGIKVWPGTTAFLRIDRYSDPTKRQVETAIDHGVDVLLLPLVTNPAEVERFLHHIAGRCRAGILVETVSACRRAKQFAEFPLDFVYVGLNDLMIDRGSRNLFAPILDGTLDSLREAFPRSCFGFGGATAVDRGSPIPCLMLLQEMARLACRFTFLRRSFKRDVAVGEMPGAVAGIHDCWKTLRRRSPADIESDHESLCARIAALAVG
jgi:hypothetical protein